MTYTVYDFINTNISGRHMRFGWKVEAEYGVLKLRYTMLNFNWKSLEFLNNEVMNMFLTSVSYQNMRNRFEHARKKFARLYVEAYDISSLKCFASTANLKVDIDKLISKTIAKKSEVIQQKNEEIAKYATENA